MKPIIGILPNSEYMRTDDSFKDIYRYGNNFVKKIIENGGIPFFIPLYNNEVIYEVLDSCDGLLLPGGNRILQANLDIVDYFYKKRKPMLGICLGMQTLASYSVSVSKEIEDKVVVLIENGVNHWHEVTRETEMNTVHKDYVEENTILFDILKKKEIMVNSIHKYMAKGVGKDFVVSALSEDGIIEGIELKDKSHFVVGVQFHPEVLPQYNEIFKRFVEECKKDKETL